MITYLKSNKAPLVSVIIPVYNSERYLPQCLDSLLAQSYTHVELICVDDGSKDSSWEILKEYAKRDARVKVFHQENSGVSKARNNAIDKATGDYLAFVDSDDWLELDAYDRCVSALENKINVDVCFYGYQMTFAEGKKYVDKYMLPTSRGEMEVNTDLFLNHELLAWNKMIRKTFWDKYGFRFPENCAYAEDAAVMFCLLSKIDKIYCVCDPLYNYRQHEESAVGKSTRKKVGSKILDNIYSWEYVCLFLKKWGGNEASLKALPFVFWRFARIAEELAESEMKGRIREEAYRIARKLRVEKVETCYGTLHLLQDSISPLWRFFHWYRGNVECFGLFGRSLWSITYYPTHKTHRLMGKYIFNTSYRTLL